MADDKSTDLEYDDDEIEVYRQRVEESLFEVITQQDKYLLTLASSLIAVTVGFASNMMGIGKPPIVCINLLYTAWWLWFSCIACVLSSFACSQFAHNRILKHIEDGTFRYTVTRNCWIKVITTFNILSFIAFIVAGLVFLNVAILNIH